MHSGSSEESAVRSWRWWLGPGSSGRKALVGGGGRLGRAYAELPMAMHPRVPSPAHSKHPLFCTRVQSVPSCSSASLPSAAAELIVLAPRRRLTTRLAPPPVPWGGGTSVRRVVVKSGGRDGTGHETGFGEVFVKKVDCTEAHHFLRVIVNGLSGERNETTRVVGLMCGGDGGNV